MLNGPRLGVTNYAGPAIDALRNLKYANHSEIADEDRVREQYGHLEADLAQDHIEFIAEIQKQIDEAQGRS
jgi:hypothetical protein